MSTSLEKPENSSAMSMNQQFFESHPELSVCGPEVQAAYETIRDAYQFSGRAATEAAQRTRSLLLGSCRAMKVLCDVLICTPDKLTPEIQENHLIINHTLCGVVEEVFFSS